MTPVWLAIVALLTGAGDVLAQSGDGSGRAPQRFQGSRAGAGESPGSHAPLAGPGRAEVDAAGNTRYYDTRGGSRGSSTPSSNGTTTTHYDAVGRRTGSSERSSNGTTTTHYGPSGLRSGSSETTSGGITNTYDASGRISGSSRVLSNGQTVYYDAAGRMITR